MKPRYNPQLAALKAKGFHGETFSRVLDRTRLAQDAALVTAPNMGIPGELTTFFDPEVVEVLTAPRRAREITGGREVVKGDATTVSAKFPVLEFAGHSEPYNDYASGGTVGVNYNWVTRDNYLFSTTRRYGDLEEARHAEAKINLASDLQKAAAHVLDVDANRFFFYGVAGIRNYGLLNDPDLLPNITPAANGTSSSPLWKNKTTNQIYGDILTLFQTLVTRTQGVVTENDELVLAMSPGLAVRLATPNDLGLSVLKMLADYFSKLRIVKAPEYNTASGELMQLIAVSIEGQESIYLASSEKFYAFAPVREVSSVKQKFRAGTFGAIVRRPVAVAGMLGM